MVMQTYQMIVTEKISLPLTVPRRRGHAIHAGKPRSCRIWLYCEGGPAAPLGSLSRKLGQVHRLSGLQGPAAEGLNNGCARFRLSPGSRTVQRSWGGNHERVPGDPRCLIPNPNLTNGAYSSCRQVWTEPEILATAF